VLSWLRPRLLDDQMSIIRNVIKLLSIKSKMLQKGYAYVRLSFFQGPVGQQLQKAIKKLKRESGGKLSGLIFDLRSNPGGLLDVSGDVAAATAEIVRGLVAAAIPIYAISPAVRDLEAIFREVNEQPAGHAQEAAHAA